MEVPGLALKYLQRVMSKAPVTELCNKIRCLQARHMLDGVARALAYLHARHICHGDVYAHNVLSDASGRSVLCDYGAATHSAAQAAGQLHMQHDSLQVLQPALSCACVPAANHMVGSGKPVCIRRACQLWRL